MMDIPEFYILGLPIETEIGECNFLKVREYPEYFMDLQVVALTKIHIYNKYHELNKDGSLNEFLEHLNNASLFEITSSIPQISESYEKLFQKVFDNKKILNQIDEKNFSYYRSLVLKMNGIKEEEVNPNPEIQRAIERSRRVKSQDGDKLEFADIVTSIIGHNGLTYDDLNEFTIFQLYMTFHRIAQIKNYDTSTLFATVASDKIKIDSWSKHINLFEDEKHGISREEFNSTTKKVFED